MPAVALHRGVLQETMNGKGRGTHPLAAHDGKDRVYPGLSVRVEFDRPEVRRYCRNPLAGAGAGARRQ